ncbi:hypothetical protein F5Y18DRAFT_434223 [Xylariaceae sp. FL1019]|nr:hypothetical protein F5Y18DRAFT_434223 [Xylariaceae sp. FL1019]
MTASLAVLAVGSLDLFIIFLRLVLQVYILVFLTNDLGPFMSEQDISFDQPRLRDMHGLAIAGLVILVLFGFFKSIRLFIANDANATYEEYSSHRDSYSFTLPIQLFLLGADAYLAWCFWTLGHGLPQGVIAKVCIALFGAVLGLGLFKMALYVIGACCGCFIGTAIALTEANRAPAGDAEAGNNIQLGPVNPQPINPPPPAQLGAR